MRRAWVVGATGMLGQAICRVLAHRGITAVGAQDRCDLRDLAAVRQTAHRLACADPEPLLAVFNCAAMTDVDACEDRSEEAMAINGEGAGHVAEAALAQGLPLVHISTDYVFSGDASQPLTEDTACRPANVYGASKHLGEQRVAQKLAEHPGGWAATVRTSWLFGDAGHHFVATMRRLMALREELWVVDDQLGRPTYAPDLAEWAVDLVGLGAAARALSGTYHFANLGEVTWHGFALEIWRRSEVMRVPLKVARILPVSSAQFPRRATRPHYSVLATDKIEAAVGRVPRGWQAALGTHLAAQQTSP